MILTTHAITGATLATLTPHNPVLAFIIGFVSHFLLDAIPHLDYTLKSVHINKGDPMSKDITLNKIFRRDLIKVGLDGISGLILTFILFKLFLGNNYSIFVIFVGAIAAMLPDALQFMYCKWKHEPLITLQRFHVFMHSEKKMGDKPLLGILSQVLVVIFFILMLL